MIWSKVKWLVNVYKDVSKSGFPLTQIGARLTLGGLAASGVFGISIQFTEQVPLVSSLKFTLNDASIVLTGLSALVVVAGLWLIFISARVLCDKQPKIARVMVLGLPHVEQNFPDHLLSKLELYLARTPVFLNQQESPIHDIQKQIDCFNAEASVSLLSKFVLHNGCEQVYIGGLARIPFLVAYGAMFSNCIAKIIYFDKSHLEHKHILLDDIDEHIEITFNQQPIANEQGDVAIAVGSSLTIEDHQLPKYFISHTVFAELNIATERNLIKNQPSLARIAAALVKQIDQLSQLQGVKRIHLFLSVQSVLALEIGRHYQAGTHKPWVIHNFDAGQSQYSWALVLDKSGLSLFQPSEFR